MKAYLQGVSTRKVDDLVRALGADTGISESEVKNPGYLGDFMLRRRGWKHEKTRQAGPGYSAEEKAAAVRIVRTLRAELGENQGTVQRVATQLGYGPECMRFRVNQRDSLGSRSAISWCFAL